jgi:hypothetical protein
VLDCLDQVKKQLSGLNAAIPAFVGCLRRGESETPPHDVREEPSKGRSCTESTLGSLEGETEVSLKAIGFERNLPDWRARFAQVVEKNRDYNHRPVREELPCH